MIASIYAAGVSGDYDAKVDPNDPLTPAESVTAANPANPANQESGKSADPESAKAGQSIGLPGADVAPPGKRPADDSNNRPGGELSMTRQSADIQANAIARGANEIALDDLREQFRMAESAELMATVTVWLLVLGVLGSGLLFWTLLETRRTANAAVDQLKQGRAWIAYKRACNGKLVGDTCRVTFYIANHGTSAANRIVIKKARYSVHGANVANPNAAMGDALVESIEAGLLGPGVEFALSFSFSQADLRDVIASSEAKKIIVWIHIAYATLDIQDAETEHTFEVVPLICDANGELLETSVRPIGPGNRAK